MDANGHKYVENDLCFKVTGCAMEVLNAIGHGLREKTYECRSHSEFQACQTAMEESSSYRESLICVYSPPFAV
ncbi:MAG: hypothetical protein JXR23_01825 [Pontiellaceae bacterium]|nr:hypothetical protein [Pontiellaceae bacterium]